MKKEFVHVSVIALAIGLLWFGSVRLLFLSPPNEGRAAQVTIDSTVHTTATTHNGTTLTVAFTSDQTGYSFYRDASGSCGYRKTTDGGATWTTTTTLIDTQTDCLRIAIWYDRWTPGNATGTIIHVSTIDSGSDNVWYNYLDTSGDTLGSTTAVNATGINQGGTFAAGSNLQAITRGTDGTLYMGVQDASDSFVIQCTGSCVATSGSWTEAGTNPFSLANDWLLLAPITNGRILAVRWSLTLDDVQSKIWTPASSSWSGAWTNIDTNCIQNGTYDGHFGLSINKNTNSVLMAFGCDLSTIGANNDDIRTAIFNSSNSTWATTTDAVTNDTKGITGVKLGLDDNTGNIYVVYSARATSTISTSTNVYYKVSTSTMLSWGAEQGPLNTAPDDIYGLRIDGLNADRIYATWVGVTADSLYGNTVADLVPTTFEQSGYRWFTNQNATSVGPPFALQNTSSVAPSIGNPFRLRMLVHVGGDGADVNRESFDLQVATSTAGGCDTAFSGETYVDVSTSTGEIRFYDNSSSSDNTALKATSTDPVHGIDTVVNQTYEEANPFTNSIAKIFGGQDGKWDFSLYNASATPMSTYCFRIVRDDGSPLSTYSAVPEITIDDPPSVSGVVLNDDTNIALTEGVTWQIFASGTITDSNGYADIVGAQAKVYRSGVGRSCSPNDNNCYQDSSCSLAGCSGTTCKALCFVNVQYFADPTDTDTPYEAESWLASIEAVDARSATSTATSTAIVDVLSLLALAVTPQINYGSLSPGAIIDPLSATSSVSASGNVSIDTTLYGANMTSGAESISVSNERYATTSIPFSSGTVLLASPGAALDLNIPKTSTSTSQASSTVFWGIQVPLPQPTGNYTGINTFIATENTLPWP
ncbi:MAG: hypothetical protein AAB495_03370 [Patescibacteria group bacterium]